MTKLSILVISDDSANASGFGGVIRNLFGRLKRNNPDTFNIESIGLYPDASIKPRVIDVVKPIAGDEHGVSTFIAYSQKKKFDIVFLLGDWWYWNKTLLNPEWRAVHKVTQKIWYYVPLDGYCVDAEQQKAYKGADRLIAMTPFGHTNLLDIVKGSNIPVDYIPHGYDQTIFFPRETKEDREEFTFGVVSRNARRKNIWAIMAAYKEIEKIEKEKVKLFIHTPVNDLIGGNLKQLAAYLELENVEFTDGQKVEYPNVSGYKDSEMWDEVYSQIDCLVSAGREGFCLPALECAACSIPLVLPNYSGHHSMNYPKTITYGVKYLKPDASGVMDMHVEVDLLKEAMMQVYTRKEWATIPFKNLNWDQVATMLEEKLKTVKPEECQTKEHLASDIMSKYRIGRKVSISKSILVTMPASHGDVMLTTAAMHSLKTKYPDHEIVFATGKKYFELVQDCPWITRVEEFNELIHDHYLVMHRIHDIVYTPHFVTQRAANWVHGGHGKSLAEVYAEHCGVPLGEYWCPVTPFEIPSPNYVTLHTGSGKGEQEARKYNHWDEAVHKLTPFVEILQIGTNADLPIKGTIDLRGKLSISESSYLISKAKCHVGIDSFPMHVSAVLGTPSVIIWGNTFPQCTGPESRLRNFMRPIEATERKEECPRPCHTINCKYCNEALNKIHPLQIVNKIMEIL